MQPNLAGANAGAERCTFKYPWFPTQLRAMQAGSARFPARRVLCLQPSASMPRVPSVCIPPCASHPQFAAHHTTLRMWFPAQLRAMQAGSARFPARRITNSPSLPHDAPLGSLAWAPRTRHTSSPGTPTARGGSNMHAKRPLPSASLRPKAHTTFYSYVSRSLMTPRASASWTSTILHTSHGAPRAPSHRAFAACQTRRSLAPAASRTSHQALPTSSARPC